MTPRDDGSGGCRHGAAVGATTLVEGPGAGCHGGSAGRPDGGSRAGGGAGAGGAAGGEGPLRIALVGNPNVGKSVLFNRLTGSYVTVSNYPGTSVELTRGPGRVGGRDVEVVDTPGLYSLLPGTEEERVARRIVLRGEADVLVHVVDAKSLDRMLPLTFQLAETGRPLVVVLNMMDEAERLGVSVDASLLEERLGVPVVPMVAVEGRGFARLAGAVERAAGGRGAPAPPYANGVGEAVGSLRERLSDVYPVDPAVLASLLLQGDEEVGRWVAEAEGDAAGDVVAAADEIRARLDGEAAYRMAVERRRVAEAVGEGVVADPRTGSRRWVDRAGRALARPATGIPVLLLVLYLGLYKFVGQFGAGTVVDWIEVVAFEGTINPWLESFFAGIPWEWLRSLYVGDYGLLTLGVRYAVAIVLPVVGTFFLFFSILEDSGYFPRLALLVDRVFKKLGLSGRAVIPIVLGFACDTMATMVTRTLETRRERILSTLLLALAIPCSAQLGVILAILAASPFALGIWGTVVLASFLLVGWIAARLFPGEVASFHMELPPLRRPRVGNVLTKTYTRMHWYFMEVLPLFLLASILLWAGKLTGLFGVVVGGLRPVVSALGLPAETATVFLFGFFRRDYGAAGLFDLHQAGILDPVQLTVAAVTLTLFVPCVAQFLMMQREHGGRIAAGTFAFATGFAFAVGAGLNLLLRGLGL